jgi:hypothetical protein
MLVDKYLLEDLFQGIRGRLYIPKANRPQI